jgi:hypothetical protein
MRFPAVARRIILNLTVSILLSHPEIDLLCAAGGVARRALLTRRRGLAATAIERLPGMGQDQ